MNTASSGTTSKASKDAARKRRRRMAIGVGVGGAGVGLLLWLLSKNTNSDADGDVDPGALPDPTPSDGGKRGGSAEFRDEPPGGDDPGGLDPGPDDGFDPDDDPLPDDDVDPGEPDPEEPDPGGLGSEDPSSGGKGNKGKGGGGRPGPSGPRPDAKAPRRVNPSRGKASDADKGPRRTNPKGGTTPKGPDPKIKDLDRYYNADWPDPGKFYQVGSRDADGFYGIAWRWFYTSLFLAAKNAGGLDDEAARDWAAARVGAKGVAQAGRADFVLCAAWNDIVYGCHVVASKNRRGPHGRGIDLVPQHADNWRRIRERRRVRRNVYVGKPGTVGTPRNAGKGNAKLPLLWMPRLSDQVLWDSDGRKLEVAGSWADGSSFYFPPPSVMNLGIDDATGSASQGVWGCGEGEGSYG